MRTVLSRLRWFCFGALLAVVLAECVLRWLPVSTGLRRTEQFARWPLQNADPRQPYSYSITWAMLNAHRGVTNNYGHVAPFDFKPNSQPVIVVGDSYIEGLMNNYADTLQGQLGELLHAPQSVYGLGVSGLSASDYLALAKQARDEFAPRAAVFAITDGDLSESLFSRAGSYFLVPSVNGLALRYWPVSGDSLVTRLRKIFGEISLHRYFQINLQFAPENLLDVFRSSANPVDTLPRYDASAIETQRQVADWFLSELPAASGIAAPCIALLFDTDRYAIYSDKLATPRKDNPVAWRYFMQRARQLGYRVSDLDPVFRERYAQQRDKFDHWPIDRHWNRLGHGIAAAEAHRLLFQDEPGAPSACAAKEGPVQRARDVPP